MHRWRAWLGGAALLLLAACAERPVNPPIAEFTPGKGYILGTRGVYARDKDNLVILAFSGGGTRAAAFSYGVLEALRRIEITRPEGGRSRFLDDVDIITGVSGGSFTALAYGLYGDRLFDDYEERFLKRNVQAELIARTLNPLNWGKLSSTAWGRSELAADLYDEILFHGATFKDLDRGPGPLISINATDLSSGTRVSFTQDIFNVFCSDLDLVRLSRAAAASSAVPLVLSPVTLNNYGGTCNFRVPDWLLKFSDPASMPRPAARMASRLKQLETYNDSARRPYIHLVDGGISDNVGLRGALEVFQAVLASHALGQPTPLDHIKRVVVFVVNSQSDPSTDWDKSEAPPGMLSTLLKATGVPIDNNSDEAVEQLKDIAANWHLLHQIRELPAFDAARDPSLREVANAPDVGVYVVDVSFNALKDRAEFEYLNNLPTSFSLPEEAIDRLRAAAGKLIADLPEFRRLVADIGAPANVVLGSRVRSPR